jgi:class 3 adenylate cyclase
MAATVRTGAVLFTDMVSSTELRSRLGDDAANCLRRAHDDLLGAVVERFAGTVLRWTGDGLKASFAAASDAVDAATEIQRAVADYGRSPDAVAAFQVRIGIAAGEMVHEDGDDHGVPVIEAARLEASARPGEILATDIVRVLCPPRAAVTFELVGERRLKGLDRPIVVHRVVDLSASSIPALPGNLAAEASRTFVGRRAEMEVFSAAFTAARLGSGSSVLVCGPAGIGRTRFLAECGAVAYDHGALVLSGRCIDALSVPYEPFVEALRPLADLDVVVGAAVRDGTGPLARLFSPGDANTAAEPVSARLDLFDAVASLLSRVARVHPTVLILDDLHRASASTLALLSHVLAETSQARVSAVGSCGDADVSPEHPVSSVFVVDGSSAAPPAVVVLGRLTDADIHSLVTTEFPSLPLVQTAALAQFVQGESNGTPVFTSALLDHLVSTGQTEVNGAQPFVVPATVRDIVLERVAVLPQGLHDVLTCAAVIGATFDVEVLASVTGRSVDVVLDRMGDAVRSGLVADEGAGRFGFSQSVVRSALIEGIGVAHQADLNRRVADALQAIESVEYDRLAHHLRLAGDASASMRYETLAARRDMTALAFESARARYQAVVDHLARDRRADSATRAEAWLGLAAAGRAMGDPTFTDAVVRAAHLARSAGSAALLAEAAALSIWPGSFFFLAEESETELIELCEDALELLDARDPARVRVLATLASHRTFDADTGRKTELIAEALSLADQLGDPELSSLALNAEFVCLWEPDTHPRRVQIARHLGRLARATGDPEMTFLSGFFDAYTMAEAGELAAARDRLVPLVEFARSIRNGYFTYLAERLVLSIDITRCEPDAAHRVDDLHARYTGSYYDTSGTWAIQTGGLAIHTGTLGGLVGTMQAMTTGQQARTWTAALAMARLWAGDRDGAADIVAAHGDIPRNYFWLPVVQARASVAAELGLTDVCHDYLHDLWPYRGRVGITASGSLCVGLVSRSVGELCLVLGRVDDALVLLSEAVDHAERIGMVHEAVVCRRLLATAQRASGDETGAQRLIEEARPVAVARGFTREVDLLESLAVQH